jgi:hypothetical protein
MLALTFSMGTRVARGQEESKPVTEENKAAARRADSGKPTTAGGTEKTVRPYRAEFVITELEDGKKINSRHYSLLLNAGNWSELRIGTRVPSGPDVPGQFLDVGTTINCRLVDYGPDVEIDVSSDFSNFFSNPNQEHVGKPIVRQIKITGNTLVMSGKPVTIGVVDDPNSDRQFQLEATVTKLR